MIKKLMLTAALICGPAHAEFMTGNELLNRFNTESYADQGFAMGFVAGVADAMDNILLCMPEGATVGQARDIAIRYLRNNPQSRHRGASALVVDALSGAWPCARNKGSRL